MGREDYLSRLLRTLGEYDVNDLRNHVPRAANHHLIANSQPQALYFIGVVQSSITHQNTGHMHRLQASHRGDGSGTPHLKLDVAHESHLLLRRELKRHRPARRAGHKSKLFLKRQGIDFDDHAINIKT